MIVDRGMEDFLKSLSGAESSTKVGVFEGSRIDSHLTNAEIVIINEFGGESSGGHPIPSRALIRGTMDRDKKAIRRTLIKQAKNIVDGKKTPSKAMDFVGRSMVKRFKKTIDKGTGMVRNAPMTIALKGFDQPFFETGTVRDAFEHKPGDA